MREGRPKAGSSGQFLKCFALALPVATFLVAVIATETGLIKSYPPEVQSDALLLKILFVPENQSKPPKLQNDDSPKYLNRTRCSAPNLKYACREKAHYTMFIPIVQSGAVEVRIEFTCELHSLELHNQCHYSTRRLAVSPFVLALRKFFSPP